MNLGEIKVILTWPNLNLEFIETRLHVVRYLAIKFLLEAIYSMSANYNPTEIHCVILINRLI